MIGDIIEKKESGSNSAFIMSVILRNRRPFCTVGHPLTGFRFFFCVFAKHVGLLPAGVDSLERGWVLLSFGI